MGEMGSLLSLMIQGRKIEFRFGGVRLFLPGSYKALASFSTRDVDRWVSTIQPRYLFARQPTPDLRFNQKPFDVPSDDASLYLRFRRRANTSFKLHPLETCVNGTSRYLSTMRRLSIMNNGRTGQVLSRHFTVSSSPHLLIIKISTTRGMTLFVKWIERRDKVESKTRWIFNFIFFFFFFTFNEWFLILFVFKRILLLFFKSREKIDRLLCIF